MDRSITTGTRYGISTRGYFFHHDDAYRDNVALARGVGMIDTLGATIAAVVAGGVLIAAATRIRRRSTRVTAWLLFAVLGVNVLLQVFDAWSMSGTTDLGADAEFGGLAKGVHHGVLIAILVWSTLAAGLALLGWGTTDHPSRRPPAAEPLDSSR